MPSMVSPVRQKVPVRWRPFLSPMAGAAARLACTSAPRGRASRVAPSTPGSGAPSISRASGSMPATLHSSRFSTNALPVIYLLFSLTTDTHYLTFWMSRSTDSKMVSLAEKLYYTGGVYGRSMTSMRDDTDSTEGVMARLPLQRLLHSSHWHFWCSGFQHSLFKSKVTNV